MNQLIGNRVTERDIRDWLNENGWYGNSAQIDDLELHAISRSGWVQVFGFRAVLKRRSVDSDSESLQGADRSTEKREYLGVCRDDERRGVGVKIEVELFDAVEQQQSRLKEWSEDLIVRSSENSLAVLMFVAVMVVGFIAIAAIVSWIN